MPLSISNERFLYELENETAYAEHLKSEKARLDEKKASITDTINSLEEMERVTMGSTHSLPSEQEQKAKAALTKINRDIAALNKKIQEANDSSSSNPEKSRLNLCKFIHTLIQVTTDEKLSTALKDIQSKDTPPADIQELKTKLQAELGENYQPAIDDVTKQKADKKKSQHAEDMADAVIVLAEIERAKKIIEKQTEEESTNEYSGEEETKDGEETQTVDRLISPELYQLEKAANEARAEANTIEQLVDDLTIQLAAKEKQKTNADTAVQETEALLSQEKVKLTAAKKEVAEKTESANSATRKVAETQTSLASANKEIENTNIEIQKIILELKNYETTIPETISVLEQAEAAESEATAEAAQKAAEADAAKAVEAAATEKAAEAAQKAAEAAQKAAEADAAKAAEADAAKAAATEKAETKAAKAAKAETKAAKAAKAAEVELMGGINYRTLPEEAAATAAEAAEAKIAAEEAETVAAAEKKAATEAADTAAAAETKAEETKAALVTAQDHREAAVEKNTEAVQGQKAAASNLEEKNLLITQQQARVTKESKQLDKYQASKTTALTARGEAYVREQELRIRVIPELELELAANNTALETAKEKEAEAKEKKEAKIQEKTKKVAEVETKVKAAYDEKYKNLLTKLAAHQSIASEAEAEAAEGEEAAKAEAEAAVEKAEAALEELVWHLEPENTEKNTGEAGVEESKGSTLAEKRKDLRNQYKQPGNVAQELHIILQEKLGVTESTRSKSDPFQCLNKGLYTPQKLKNAIVNRPAEYNKVKEVLHSKRQGLVKTLNANGGSVAFQRFYQHPACDDQKCIAILQKNDLGENEIVAYFSAKYGVLPTIAAYKNAVITELKNTAEEGASVPNHKDITIRQQEGQLVAFVNAKDSNIIQLKLSLKKNQIGFLPTVNASRISETLTENQKTKITKDNEASQIESTEWQTKETSLHQFSTVTPSKPQPIVQSEVNRTGLFSCFNSRAKESVAPNETHRGNASIAENHESTNDLNSSHHSWRSTDTIPSRSNSQSSTISEAATAGMAAHICRIGSGCTNLASNAAYGLCYLFIPVARLISFAPSLPPHLN